MKWAISKRKGMRLKVKHEDSNLCSLSGGNNGGESIPSKEKRHASAATNNRYVGN